MGLHGAGAAPVPTKNHYGSAEKMVDFGLLVLEDHNGRIICYSPIGKSKARRTDGHRAAKSSFSNATRAIRSTIRERLMLLALGISVHTGWAACVVAAGSLASPYIEVREEIEILGDADRFVFHVAAKLPIEDARRWVEEARLRASERAAEALERIASGRSLAACALIGSNKPMPEPLEHVLAAHPRLHAAESCFYRDILRAEGAARGLAVRLVSPKSLDIAAEALGTLGRRLGPPWGKDQKLAALAAWQALRLS
ncbi:hypothetical protein LVJ94_48970 [Pendulispora rubella]|uniref:Uncharacterized protein n=1 Tax=Pendulispora rubella TaxID=2741070 RepID=A0ABZ2L5G3_9BACT